MAWQTTLFTAAAEVIKKPTNGSMESFTGEITALTEILERQKKRGAKTPEATGAIRETTEIVKEAILHIISKLPSKALGVFASHSEAIATPKLFDEAQTTSLRDEITTALRASFKKDPLNTAKGMMKGSLYNKPVVQTIFVNGVLENRNALVKQDLGFAIRAFARAIPLTQPGSDEEDRLAQAIDAYAPKYKKLYKSAKDKQIDPLLQLVSNSEGRGKNPNEPDAPGIDMEAVTLTVWNRYIDWLIKENKAKALVAILEMAEEGYNYGDVRPALVMAAQTRLAGFAFHPRTSPKIVEKVWELARNFFSMASDRNYGKETPNYLAGGAFVDAALALLMPITDHPELFPRTAKDFLHTSIVYAKRVRLSSTEHYNDLHENIVHRLKERALTRMEADNLEESYRDLYRAIQFGSPHYKLVKTIAEIATLQLLPKMAISPREKSRKAIDLVEHMSLAPGDTRTSLEAISPIKDYCLKLAEQTLRTDPNEAATMLNLISNKNVFRFSAEEARRFVKLEQQANTPPAMDGPARENLAALKRVSPANALRR